MGGGGGRGVGSGRGWGGRGGEAGYVEVTSPHFQRKKLNAWCSFSESNYVLSLADVDRCRQRVAKLCRCARDSVIIYLPSEVFGCGKHDFFIIIFLPRSRILSQQS